MVFQVRALLPVSASNTYLKGVIFSGIGHRRSLVIEMTTSCFSSLGHVPKKLKVLLYLENDLIIFSVIMIIFVISYGFWHNLDNLFTGTFTNEIQKNIKSQSKLTEIYSLWNVHVTLIAFVKTTTKSNESNGISKTFTRYLTRQSAEVSSPSTLKSIKSYKELYFQLGNFQCSQL